MALNFQLKDKDWLINLKQTTKTNSSALFGVYETHITGKAIHGSEVKLKFHYKQV